MEQLDFHPQQRPGDKDLELDEKRTEECYFQQVKQELGILSEGSHVICGVTLESVHKRGVGPVS